MPAAVPPVSMLRPALELVWAVAKVGSQARPPLPVPGRLRPLMKVSRLPDRMLTTVREVVDGDEDFRRRAIPAADEGLLGRPSWLWLVRPEGWEDELASLVEEAESAEGEAEEKRTARAVRRRLEEVTSSLVDAKAELASLNAVNADLGEQLSAARKARREAEAETVRLRGALEEAVAGQEKLRRGAADLSDKLQKAEQQAGAARERASLAEIDRDQARRETEMSRLALAEAQREAASAEAMAAGLRTKLQNVFVAVRDAAVSAGVASVAAAPAVTPSPPDRTEGWTETPPVGAPGASAGPAKRVPARLPPATFADSPEAARHLVRLAGAVLVVDGYNVTLTSWPGADLSTQRRRLLDSLAELVMRAGTEGLVIFDGIDAGNRLQLPSSVRGRMRVQFTASEVEADEMIVDLVKSLPVHRPVVVATNDRRVREAVGEHGANVISVEQLLSVLGRGAEPEG